MTGKWILCDINEKLMRAIIRKFNRREKCFVRIGKSEYPFFIRRYNNVSDGIVIELVAVPSAGSAYRIAKGESE